METSDDREGGQEQRREARDPLVLELGRAKKSGDPYAFQREPQSYNRRFAGGALKGAELPWDKRFDEAIASLHDAKQDPAELQWLGDVLRKFLVDIGWSTEEKVLTDAIDANRAVVLTIRSSAAELYAVPWELVTLGRTTRYVGSLPNVLVRYEWADDNPSNTRPEKHSPRAEGGRILFAHSGEVPYEAHRKAIESACAAGHHDFEPARDVLSSASLRTLRDKLVEANGDGPPIAVVHLLCHGVPIGSTFGLKLDANEGGQETVVGADQLAGLFAEHADMVRLVVLAACDSGNMGALGNHMGSVAQALHRAGVASVIASRYPFSKPGSNAFTRKFYDTLLIGPSSVEEAFKAARQCLWEGYKYPERIDWASVQLYAREADGHDTRPIIFAPYRGLFSFHREHARFFCGRQNETEKLVARLEKACSGSLPRFQILAGASGSGKSSLVRAAVVPALEQKGLTPVVMRPSEVNLTSLATQLRSLAEGYAHFQRPTNRVELALVSTCRAGTVLVLVIDQLEELFAASVGVEEREAFLKSVTTISGTRETQVLVLATFRIDLLDRAGEVVIDDAGGRLDALISSEESTMMLAQLGPANFVEIIERPAGRAGLEVDPDLRDTLVNETARERGGLPLLEYALDHLWRLREGRRLTLQRYGELFPPRDDEVRGVRHVLLKLADNVLQELREEDPALEDQARRIFLSLVDLRAEAAFDTRKRALVADLRPREAPADALFDRALERLLESRLIVVDRAQDDRPVEGGRTTPADARILDLAHEALIRHWRPLTEWVAKDRDFLRRLEELNERARLWENSNRHSVHLLQGPLLRAALPYRSRIAAESDSAKKLVNASLRRFRLARLGAVVLAAGLLVYGVRAYRNTKSETAARARAYFAKNLSDSQKAMTQYANESREADADADDLLSLIAYLEKMQGDSYTNMRGFEWHHLEQRSLDANVSLTAISPAREWATDPAHDRLAVIEERGRVAVFQLSERRRSWSSHVDGGGRSVAFSPDGALLAVGSNMELVLCPADQPKSYQPNHGCINVEHDMYDKTMRGERLAVAFSSNGKRLAVGTTADHDERAGSVRILDVRTEPLGAERAGTEWSSERIGPIVRVGFRGNDDGEVVALDADGRVAVFDARTGAEKRPPSRVVSWANSSAPPNATAPFSTNPALTGIALTNGSELILGKLDVEHKMTSSWNASSPGRYTPDGGRVVWRNASGIQVSSKDGKSIPWRGVSDGEPVAALDNEARRIVSRRSDGHLVYHEELATNWSSATLSFSDPVRTFGTDPTGRYAFVLFGSHGVKGPIGVRVIELATLKNVVLDGQLPKSDPAVDAEFSQTLLTADGKHLLQVGDKTGRVRSLLLGDKQASFTYWNLGRHVKWMVIGEGGYCGVLTDDDVFRLAQFDEAGGKLVDGGEVADASAASFAPRGSRVVVGSRAGTVHLIDAAARTRRASIQILVHDDGDQKKVSGAQLGDLRIARVWFSPDGERVHAICGGSLIEWQEGSAYYYEKWLGEQRSYDAAEFDPWGERAVRASGRHVTVSVPPILSFRQPQSHDDDDEETKDWGWFSKAWNWPIAASYVTPSEATTPRFSPDGQTLLATLWRTQIALWRATARTNANSRP